MGILYGGTEIGSGMAKRPLCTYQGFVSNEWCIFWTEYCALCQTILYGGLPQKNECHIHWHGWLMRRLLLPWITGLVLCLNTLFLERIVCSCLWGIYYIPHDDARITNRKMQHCLRWTWFFVNQNHSFLLFMFAIKKCNIEAHTALSFERSKSNSIYLWCF